MEVKIMRQTDWLVEEMSKTCTDTGRDYSFDDDLQMAVGKGFKKSLCL